MPNDRTFVKCHADACSICVPHCECATSIAALKMIDGPFAAKFSRSARHWATNVLLTVLNSSVVAQGLVSWSAIKTENYERQKHPIASTARASVSTYVRLLAGCMARLWSRPRASRSPVYFWEIRHLIC